MYTYNIIPTHIRNIKIGDTIIYNNILTTISRSNLSYCSFMGATIYGDSFKLGTILVQKVELTLAKNAKYYSIDQTHDENNLIIHDKDLSITKI